MQDKLELVARPEGVVKAGMDNDLVWRTNPETDENCSDDPPLLANPGFVYFIRAGRTNAVKIGWALNPDKRLRELQTASPHPLYMIGYLPGTMFDEAEWHQRFVNERIRGEWFTLSFRLRSAINALQVSDCGFVAYLSLSLLTRNAG